MPEADNNPENPSSQKQTIDSSFFANILFKILPIHKNEINKFVNITALMFCILFIQNVIRATKDSVVNTMIGVESVSFLKVWGVMPAAILFAAIYVKLLNILKPEALFYAIISAFIGFFTFFAFVIFPYHDSLHMSSELASKLVDAYPHLKWFILLIANWGFSLFYIIAELWPNAAYSVLFWQFVNGVTSVDQSKRFYPLFALFGQTGLFFSGSLLVAQTNIGIYLHNSIGIGNSTKVASLQFVMSVVIILGFASLYFFRRINEKVLEVRANDLVQYKASKKEKISVLASFKLAATSRYIMLIAVMLTCYGLAINLVEGPWKAMVAKAYPNTADNLAFVGSYLRMTGIFTILFVLVGSNIVKWLGWFAAAVITPSIMFLTGLVFYYSANFQSDFLIAVCTWIGYDPLILAVVFGAIQNVVTKSTKYTLFDSTKEMAYVPLEDDLKIRGKAAVDSIGIKLGKSASAFIQQTIFILIPTATFETISPYLMVIFIIVCVIWLYAVRDLGYEYEKLTLESEK